jgi:hypothetical protein
MACDLSGRMRCFVSRQFSVKGYSVYCNGDEEKVIWGAFIILCVLSAATYRLGGTSAGTKWRDIGTSACLVAALALLGAITDILGWLSIILVFGLLLASLTTYRYFLPKPSRYTCWYFGLHGFMVAFADLPYAWVMGKWISFGIRCVTCSVLVGAWSGWISNANMEEGGRGFIFCVTRLIYLLPF